MEVWDTGGRWWEYSRLCLGVCDGFSDLEVLYSFRSLLEQISDLLQRAQVTALHLVHSSLHKRSLVLKHTEDKRSVSSSCATWRPAVAGRHSPQHGRHASFRLLWKTCQQGCMHVCGSWQELAWLTTASPILICCLYYFIM